MAGLSRFFFPEASRRLLVDEGEFIVDEVRRHWVRRVVPVLTVLAGMGCFALMPALGRLWWLPLIAGLGLGARGFYVIHREFMDRFVVTNMRVFRIHGVFNRKMATVPLARILDITVIKPLPGRLLRYGHFVFESAAQEQGLREIRYVGRPDERDLAIQRVIQRSGVRGRVPGQVPPV